MAHSQEIGRSQIVTRDGVVTVVVVDTVSADTMQLMLSKGSASALYGGVADKTALVGRDVKDLIIFPFSEL